MELILVVCGISLTIILVLLIIGVFIGRASESNRIIEDLRDSTNNDIN